jgi:hypothetical protein
MYYCSEFIPGYKSGEWISRTCNQDAQRLSFADQSLYLIASNFEHLPDDLAGAQAGGILSFTVPLYEADRTVQIATLKDGTIHWPLTPEFHSSRSTGPNSVPMFWRFSMKDISKQVALSGFREASLVCVIFVPQQLVLRIVTHAVK